MAKSQKSSSLHPKKNKAASAKSSAKTTTQKSTTVSVEDKKSKSENDVSAAKLPSAWSILLSVVRLFQSNWRLLLGVTAVYTVLTFLLVQGSAAVADFDSLKKEVGDANPGIIGQLSTGFALFGLLVIESNNNAADVMGAYQGFLNLIVSLAVVWLLRQIMAGENKLRIRDGFYKGMYPLVPVLLVLSVVLLQILPFLLGAAIFNITVTGGIAISTLEALLWSLPLIIGTYLTLYWLTSSIIAVYVVTLPDMTPLQALKSARELVRYRRLSVLRKLLFLPLAVFVLLGVIMIPVILIMTAIAPWVFFLLSMFVLVITHAYLYMLYRELLA